MKKLLILTGLLGLLFSCESGFQVYTDEFEPVPVVYCFVNPADTVHYIRIGRSFSSRGDPDIYSKSADSINYEKVDIRVRLINNQGDTVFVEAVTEHNPIKEDGFFSTEGFSVYSFNKVLSHRGYALFKSIELDVEIPGLSVATGKTDFLSRVKIRSPLIAAKDLFVDTERPILVQWMGAEWNEADITFTVFEQYRDSTVSKTISFEEKTNIIRVGGIAEIRFPYELIVQSFARLLKVEHDLVRRYFGPIYIKIHSGNKDFFRYMETKDGINDFSGQTVSNIENGIGFIACKWTTIRDPLTFDYFTRQRLSSDPLLEPFKFIEY